MVVAAGILHTAPFSLNGFWGIAVDDSPSPDRIFLAEYNLGGTFLSDFNSVQSDIELRRAVFTHGHQTLSEGSICSLSDLHGGSSDFRILTLDMQAGSVVADVNLTTLYEPPGGLYSPTMVMCDPADGTCFFMDILSDPVGNVFTYRLVSFDPKTPASTLSILASLVLDDTDYASGSPNPNLSFLQEPRVWFNSSKEFFFYGGEQGTGEADPTFFWKASVGSFARAAAVKNWDVEHQWTQVSYGSGSFHSVPFGPGFFWCTSQIVATGTKSPLQRAFAINATEKPANQWPDTAPWALNRAAGELPANITGDGVGKIFVYSSFSGRILGNAPTPGTLPEVDVTFTARTGPGNSLPTIATFKSLS